MRRLRIALLVSVLALGLASGIGCGDARVQSHVAASSSKDSDRDGITDDLDKCPGLLEDGLSPNPKDGCPSNDPDQDGILGSDDKCPLVPETKNGFQDADGCPDAKVTVQRLPRVTVTKTEIKIDEKILFAFGKATIDKTSDDLIKEIAQAMSANPQIEFVEVAGHADKVGNDKLNVGLTKRRAAAVIDALAGLGIDKKRMRAAGYGRYCPIDPADTADAREKNRRVEFKILRVSGQDTGVATGCAEAAAKGIK